METLNIRPCEEPIPVDGPVRVLFAGGEWTPEGQRLRAAQRAALLRVRESSPPIQETQRRGTMGIGHVPEPQVRRKVRAVRDVRKRCETCGVEFLGFGRQKYCPRHSESIRKRGNRLSGSGSAPR